MFDSHLPFSLLTIKYEEDDSFHVKTSVYKVKTWKDRYIILLEEYINDFYVIKFFPARYKRYPDKFNRISNDGVLQLVIGTCLRILLDQIRRISRSSFGFVATPSIIDDFIEDINNNQRYRIYKQIMRNFFGKETFTHFVDIQSSAYLMVNKQHENVDSIMIEMQQGFIEMYPDLFNLQFAQL